MKKILVSWTDVENQTHEILRQLHLDQWRPDYVVGLTRGGLTPANLISQYLGCPMYSLDVSLRDTQGGPGPESNYWMAEDAFGYVPRSYAADSDQLMTETLLGGDGSFDYTMHAKNILVVDDINDTGATLNWIQQDWRDGCLPSHPRWDGVWGRNVRVAVLYDNESSTNRMDINYSAVNINKAEDDSWIVFPWEEFWKHKR
jgi:hypoxanthine phosphoribosyltransferase